MTRIIGAILVLRKLQNALHETYGAFYQLMSKTQFMPFALVAIGMCSRLSLISGAWTDELLDCYRLLETWIKTFPKEEGLPIEVDYEIRLPESVDSILPSTAPAVPNPAPQPTLQQPRTETADLGEVIERIETPLDTEPDSSSHASSLPDTANQQPPQARREPVDKLKTIISSKLKKQKASPDLDDVVVESKMTMLDPMMPVPSDSEASRGLQTGEKKKMKSKHKAGSATNFDDIFGIEHKAFDLDASRSIPARPETAQARQKKVKGSGSLLGSEKDIDSIFSSVKKSKKPATLEIDNIFGPSKKKKKKIQ
ncbi:hypothetical protein BGZ70_003612 [Mortierella alpina]|uniref:Nucleolus and neural progenitor protein-like N-terminal domain-containing protein n=1 Tax=Mortierella alpina TaxID=64518 RepID=A0A9P6JAL1_MORAP|nr:hypothetical protein BGZ70_003612 [Mortierella alpina]